MNKPKVLKEAIQKVSHTTRPERIFYIFDLDSTLFDNHPRTKAILDEFGQTIVPEHFPHHEERWCELEMAPEDWGPLTSLQRLHDFEPELLEAAEKFWAQRFFSNDYVQFDVPYPGAVHFVNSLHQRGASVGYLTGRDEPRMGHGTRSSLKSYGFPLLEKHVHLALKSSLSVKDVEHKLDYFEQVFSNFDEIWFFENEPMIVKALEDRFPQLRLIFVDTTHSGKAKKPSHLSHVTGDYTLSSEQNTQ